MKKAQLIFPHQLFQDVSHLEKEFPVFLIEEYLFFKQYKFHQQKLAFHRATMKFYEAFLKEKGFNAHYLEASSAISDVRNLIKKLENDDFETITTPNKTSFDEGLQNEAENSVKLSAEIPSSLNIVLSASFSSSLLRSKSP